MQKHRIKEELEALLNKASYHESVIGEIKRLVIDKGITDQFVRIFSKNLELINQLGREVTKTNNFEKLKDADGLYAMKFKEKQMNLRMLFSYNESSKTICLHLFYERKGKSKEEYKSHIPVAKKRMKEEERWTVN